MQAVIPAAGRGTRLGDPTNGQPKGLVDIEGQPPLAYVFETAVDAWVNELVVVVGYKAAQILKKFDDRFDGVPITYVYQHEQKGLGHAVLQVEPHVDGTFLLLNGDNVFAGVRPAVEASSDADAGLGVEEVPLTLQRQLV